jgi:sortase A
LRRCIRFAGTALIVLGVLILLWSFVVWRWNDPFTGLYTRWQQHKLANSYETRVRQFADKRVSRAARLVVDRRELARISRRYRLASGRGEALGRITARRLELTQMIVVNGTDHDSLKKGPGRDLRTFMPGEGQLVYIAGHRTTYLAPFAHIDRLRRGDRVTLELPYATFVYRVVRHVIVPADDVGRLRSRGFEELALQACHPRFFATQRYIVYAKPVRIKLRGGRSIGVST